MIAMHKLGSSPIGCEDFSIPRGITNGGSEKGRPGSVMKGFLATSERPRRSKDRVSILQ